jgi:ribokinase
LSGRVIVVGSINIDLVAAVARLPAPGETVTGAAFEQFPGGKSANQSVAAARLGASVVFVGAVGRDSFGAVARADLGSEGVDARELGDLAGPTGVALILVDRAGENVIAVASGVNGMVDPARVQAALARVRPVPGDVLLVGHEIPTRAARTGLAAGRAAGVRTVFNPAPAAGVDRSLLDLTDVLVPNRPELGQLAGPEQVGVGPANLASRLLATADGPAGVRDAVVVTLGRDGALVVRPDRSAVSYPAPAVEAVETVGAGDTFVGALAAGLAAGLDLDEAVARAVVAASLSTTRRGARTGMPTLRELEDRLAPGA